MKKKAIVIIASVCAAVLVGMIVFYSVAPIKVVVTVPDSVFADRTAPTGSSADTLPAASEPAPASTEPASSAPAAEPTSAPAEPTSVPAEQPTEQPASQAEQPSEQPATQAAPAGAMTKEQIVELYNTAVNKVKKEASSLTRNYKHVSAPEDQLELPSAIQSLGKTAIGTFVKGTDTPETWTSRDDMQIVFPVGNADYSSHLTADMVGSAVCEDTGSAYKITLKLYDDAITSPEKGQGYAGVFNTVTASTFSDINIPTVTFTRVDIKGVGGAISCTVDKASSRVTEITFTETDILDLDVKVLVSSLHVKLALATEENYTVAY
ncbi:MAG: hypothetical protein IK104_06290 [Clostridia bacterium]|nr:hypothetical protein [Clostridia bacterium]